MAHFSIVGGLFVPRYLGCSSRCLAFNCALSLGSLAVPDNVLLERIGAAIKRAESLGLVTERWAVAAYLYLSNLRVGCRWAVRLLSLWPMTSPQPN